MKLRKDKPMGGQESRNRDPNNIRSSGVESSGPARGDRYRLNVSTGVETVQSRRNTPGGAGTSSRLAGLSPASAPQSSFKGRDGNDDGPHASGIPGRVAYMKAAAKKSRGKAQSKAHGKAPKISHQAIVNSMVDEVTGALIGVVTGATALPIFGRQIFSAAQTSTAKKSSAKSMRRSQSEQLVKNTRGEIKNRIREQLQKEKQLNEKMRLSSPPSSLEGNLGAPTTRRTQSFTLPRCLHVIPEQPEEEARDPDKYSYSDINVYF